MKTFIRYFLLMVATLALISCGGGGGATSTP